MSQYFDDQYYVVLNDLGWGSPRFAYGPTTTQRAAVEFTALANSPTDTIAPTITFIMPDYIEEAAFEDVRPIEDLQSDYQSYLNTLRNPQGEPQN